MNSSIRFSFHVDFFSPFLRSQMKMEDLPLQRRCRMSDIQRVYTCWKDCRKNGKEMARSPTALYSVVLLPDCLLSFFPIFEKKAIIINSSSSIFFHFEIFTLSLWYNARYNPCTVVYKKKWKVYGSCQSEFLNIHTQYCLLCPFYSAPNTIKDRPFFGFMVRRSWQVPGRVMNISIFRGKTTGTSGFANATFESLRE